MAMEHWRKAQENQGNLFGSMVAGLLMKKFGDVPLPVERILPRFSPEASKKLSKLGYKIYPLTGQSIKDLLDAGRPIYTNWRKGDPIEEMRSCLHEVAINPSQLFPPNLYGETPEEQEELMKIYSRGFQIKHRITGVKGIIGEMPDYVETFLEHFKSTGEHLLSNPNDKSVLTKTKVGDLTLRVNELNVNNDYGLNVTYWPNDCFYSLGGLIAPLIVPTA